MTVSGPYDGICRPEPMCTFMIYTCQRQYLKTEVLVQGSCGGLMVSIHVNHPSFVRRLRHFDRRKTSARSQKPTSFNSHGEKKKIICDICSKTNYFSQSIFARAK